jgi:hypothetical protein
MTAPQGGAVFADAASAQRAVALLQPALEAATRDASVCGSGFFCIVVMDPARPPQSSDFGSAVLLEHAVGDRARWDADYAAFARAKAELAWRHGAPGGGTGFGSAIGAHRLREGECLLGGAAWLDGIVVGVSGAFEAFDEAFAMAVAAQLRAFAQQRRAEAVQGGAWRAARRAG